MSLPLYCPHWGRDCRWSHDSNGKTGQNYLKIHLRVVHPGQALPADPAVVAKPALAKTPATRVAAKPVARKQPQLTWPEERIIASIQAFAAEHGRPPKVSEWKKGEPGRPSMQTMANRFGSFNKAVAAAGYPTRSNASGRRPGRPRTVTAEQCLAAIREAAAELGHAPGSHWWKDNHRLPSSTTIALHYPTWREAIIAAGLEPHSAAHRWSVDRPAELLAAITAWADTHDGRAPSQEDWRNSTDEHPNFSIVHRAFGTWNRGVEAAGLSPRPHGRKRSSEQLRAELARLQTLEAKHLRLSVAARDEATVIERALEAA